MRADRLQLRGYRNYQELALDFSPGVNIFLGPNAQGKTNIIEAVYYAALARSHRTAKDQELIGWEAEGAAMRLSFSRLSVASCLDFLWQRGRRRRILLNGQDIRPRELVGNFTAVLFSPEDLYLIKGAPAGRRTFLDAEISQSSPAYYHELSRYQHLLQQRNALLKKIRDREAGRDMLELWDGQLAASAARLVFRRYQAVGRLSELARRCQSRISGALENLELAYELHRHSGDTAPLPWEGQELSPDSMTNRLEAWYNESMAKYREMDIARAVTGLGPHRDDLLLTVNGVDLRAYGSQGQQRTGALALKLAELDFLREGVGEYPVLLLDDVMSELDAGRRKELLAFLKREEIQTLITATDRAYFPAESFGEFFSVSAGQVRPM